MKTAASATGEVHDSSGATAATPTRTRRDGGNATAFSEDSIPQPSNAVKPTEPAAKPLPGGVNSQTFGDLDEPGAKPLPTGTEGNDGLGAADAGSVNTDYDRLQAAHKLHIVSAYMSNNNSSGSIIQALNMGNPPQLTPEAPLGSVAPALFNSKIPQPSNAVKPAEPAAKPLPGGVNSQTFGNLDEPSAKPLPTGTASNDGLGAADADSVNTDYDRLQAESDAFHPSGPSPVRHTDVPTKNFEGRNIPKSTSTIYGAQGTPDAAVMQLEQMIADGKLAFDTITDKDAVAKARTTMDSKGFDGALEQYRNTVASNAVSKNNTALGQQLLLQAMREGNTEATAELLTLYTRNSTNTAQALQAQSIFRKLSPEGQLVGIQKAVDSEKNVPAFNNGNFVGKGLNFLSDGNSALPEAEDTAA